jgi:TRAP-type C4-dicarboxylate transport system permease small subunit
MNPGSARPAPPSEPEPLHAGALGAALQLIDRLHRAVLVAGMLALLGAAGILSSSVFLRYFLHQPTDWQDEMAVFLLVGTTFLCGGYVQARRGHVGIEALLGLLSPAANRVRAVLVDGAALAFCAFFSWKSYALFLEAYREGQTTSSAWAPPLAIPYGLMFAGMLLLSLQLLLQVLRGVAAVKTGR